MVQIAIIDDDVYIGNMLEDLLSREGYRVLRAYSGTEALMLLAAHRPDLVLLDLMLPGLSGEEVLPQISGVPVIVLSAKADVSGKVRLLLEGAADYITKPFDTQELLARIKVQLRAATAPGRAATLAHGPLRMDTAAHTVAAGDTPIRLTKTEHAILKQLMQSPAQVVTKSRLLDLIAEDTPDCTESSLKVHIANLRRKLREASGQECVEAVWGIGYKLHDA